MTVTVWLTSGSVAGGLVGYLFHVLMGRMLSVEDYGLLTALLALTVVIATPLGALTMVISREVSVCRARNARGAIAQLYAWVAKRALIASATFAVAVAIFSSEIQTFLHAPSVTAILMLVGLFLMAAPQAVNNAFLQGMQHFAWLSVNGVLSTGLKTIFATVLVWVGFGVSGAVGGTLIAAGLFWCLTYTIVRSDLKQGLGKSGNRPAFPIRAMLSVLVANTAFAAMTQLDMVLVKHYFAEQEVGIYAAVSIVGKAVIYLPGGIVLALYPMTTENFSRGKPSIHLLVQALAITAILCTGGALFYLLFGESILTTLYGERYRAGGALLTYYGFAILPMALVLVFEHYLIARGRVLFAYLFLGVVPLQIGAIHWYHDSLFTVITVIAASGLVTLLIGTGFLWRTYRTQ